MGIQHQLDWRPTPLVRDERKAHGLWLNELFLAVSGDVGQHTDAF